MTDPAGGAPSPQGSGNWQAPPPPSGAPGGFQPNFQQAPVEVGPAPGVTYADIVTRIIALVIDSIILFVPYFVVMLVLAFTGTWVAFLLGGVLYLAWSAGYFVYTWTKMRCSYGQKFMSLEVVNAADGATLTQEQAIRRWAFMFGPAALAQVFSYGGSLALAAIGTIVGLLGFVYTLYLLYSVTQSPKRQGFHDVQAATVVIKHA